MDVFALRNRLIDDYGAFARSFTTVRAGDLKAGIDAAYASNRYWPDPLVQINPRYKPARTTHELAVDGKLLSATSKAFPIRLYSHQEQAVALAAERSSFIVTTGTGSGKSMCYFIPIVDAVLRAKATDPQRRTRAIVIYPMNALANSQREELLRFVHADGVVTFARYTAVDLDFIVPRVLELTYTAHDLADWARDLGYTGAPFAWNPDRRAQLRAELDAWYARLYGLTRDELRYILDPADVEGADYPSETFRVLKNNETRAFGEYRTRRLVLEAWDRQNAH